MVDKMVDSSTVPAHLGQTWIIDSLHNNNNFKKVAGTHIEETRQSCLSSWDHAMTPDDCWYKSDIAGGWDHWSTVVSTAPSVQCCQGPGVQWSQWLLTSDNNNTQLRLRQTWHFTQQLLNVNVINAAKLIKSF